MKQELNIRITGEAGQGMKTIGGVLSKIFKEAGFYIFSNLDYMSRIRGGNNFYQLRVSTNSVSSPREKIDILVPLTREALNLHRDVLAKGGFAIVDKEKFKLEKEEQYLFTIDFFRLAKETAGSDIYINSVCSGILAAICGVSFEIVKKVITNTFSQKGEEIVNKNLASAEAGYKRGEKSFDSDSLKLKKQESSPKYILDGKQAIGLGAIAAGCKFYSAYPMSPSTGVINTIAHYSDRYGILVEQAEDEIAAINMIIGASATGARAMASTSGGGFALMGEGISLAAMTETPIVVANLQRPGPATGFPTRTEQGDLNLLLGAGHGEFAKIIFTPGTIQESFYLTKKAFNLAEIYQIPALILSDQFLADSVKNIDKFDLEKEPIQCGIISKKDSTKIKDYKRYQLTDFGVSPRAVFSWINDVIYIDSDEHTEAGHITEDDQIRAKMVEKRFIKKMKALKEEVVEPVTYNLEEAENIFICFGSVYGPLFESLQVVGDKKNGLIHLPQVWPINAKMIEKLVKKRKKIFTVENNAEGQLAKLLQRETELKIKDSILKYNGRPFTLDELENQINKITDNL